MEKLSSAFMAQTQISLVRKNPQPLLLKSKSNSNSNSNNAASFYPPLMPIHHLKLAAANFPLKLFLSSRNLKINALTIRTTISSSKKKNSSQRSSIGNLFDIAVCAATMIVMITVCSRSSNFALACPSNYNCYDQENTIKKEEAKKPYDKPKIIFIKELALYSIFPLLVLVASIISDAMKNVYRVQIVICDNGGTFREDLKRILRRPSSREHHFRTKFVGRVFIRQKYPGRWMTRSALIGVTELLFEHSVSCIYGYTSKHPAWSFCCTPEGFLDRLSSEEQKKFDDDDGARYGEELKRLFKACFNYPVGVHNKETLINVNKEKVTSEKEKGLSNGYTVVTILFSTRQRLKFSTINGHEDLEKILQVLNFCSPTSVDVVWAPRKENELITENELQEKYPLLRPIFRRLCAACCCSTNMQLCRL